MSDWKPSVTVAAVIEHQGRFLVVEENTVAGVRLNQPAGHLEAGETLALACVREALEETAHHVDVVSGVGIYLARFVHEASATDVTYLRFAFACRLADRAGGAFDAGRSLDQGILRTHWLSADELRARQSEHRSPLVMQVVDDYLSGSRFDPDVLQADSSFATVATARLRAP
jgi:8-oxo-dGTP pyrophosphatase MutT (NUDIX family)